VTVTARGDQGWAPTEAVTRRPRRCENVSRTLSAHRFNHVAHTEKEKELGNGVLRLDGSVHRRFGTSDRRAHAHCANQTTRFLQQGGSSPALLTPPPRRHSRPRAGPTGAHGPSARQHKPGCRAPLCAEKNSCVAQACFSGAIHTRRQLQVCCRCHRHHPSNALWRPTACVALKPGDLVCRDCQQGVLGCTICWAGGDRVGIQDCNALMTFHTRCHCLCRPDAFCACKS